MTQQHVTNDDVAVVVLKQIRQLFVTARLQVGKQPLLDVPRVMAQSTQQL